MRVSLSSAVLALSTLLAPFAAAKSCSFAQKRAAVQAELNTIVSHTSTDALKIPLSIGATRTFYVTPNELPEVTIPVNVGLDAATVRAELVSLAAVLNAGVPRNTVHFIKNKNGTVTSDFVQTDENVLPYVHVREVHTFNDDCEIEQIVGYVHGDVACPLDNVGLTNSVLLTLCTELAAAGLIGKPQHKPHKATGYL